MRKIILIIAALGMSFYGIAQEKYVTTALTAISQKNYEEAKENIDKACQSPESKDKPKTLFAKAQVYFQLQAVDKYKDSNPYREAVQALFKLIELKPDYEKSTVDQLLAISALLYYNDGAKAYNDKKLIDAAEFMKVVVKIHDMKRFDKILPADRMRQFDTASADAALTVANCSYYQSKYEEAIPLLTAVKNNPITRTPSVYECLIDSYEHLKKNTEALAAIQEARKLFPDDVTLRNYEVNYYIQSGNQDEMLKKMEEASAKEPDNADIQFNLATSYMKLALPKPGPKPANSAELLGKSEKAFTNAVRISPDNPEYNYNFGAFYFNQATEFNDQMNAITGTSKADDDKYKDLETKRNALFGKATPYFEKAYNKYVSTEKDLNAKDRSTFKNTLYALQQIYAKQDKLEKSKEMKTKYESMN